VLAFRDRAFTEYFTDAGYLKRMARTFGVPVADEILAMTAIDIRKPS
jgi:hypothetical protein